MVSTAVLVVVLGSAVAMMVAAENRKVDEMSQDSQSKYHRQAPTQRTNPVEESR